MNSYPVNIFESDMIDLMAFTGETVTGIEVM